MKKVVFVLFGLMLASGLFAEGGDFSRYNAYCWNQIISLDPGRKGGIQVQSVYGEAFINLKSDGTGSLQDPVTKALPMQDITWTRTTKESWNGYVYNVSIYDKKKVLICKMEINQQNFVMTFFSKDGDHVYIGTLERNG
ncbi:MAG TPA: hypothetical protein PLT75_16355 [Spirochaetota bacterium]|nr:hypothetical protein [Spirochaetota bacterium]